MNNPKTISELIELPTLEQARIEVLEAINNDHAGLPNYFSSPITRELYVLHAFDYHLDLRTHWLIEFKESHRRLIYCVLNDEKIIPSKITLHHIKKRNSKDITQYMAQSSIPLFQAVSRVAILLKARRAFRC
jgi:hypothetical protein